MYSTDKYEKTDTHHKINKGKIGLALSGGGFRASFFHIGVLARLAELDLLRSVEVISTVSGGTIIGALYYLHVKKLLESKTDNQVKASDYVTIIQNLEKDFLRGVQKNLRIRAYSNLIKNFKMVRLDYSRSDRMAELYDKYFYDHLGLGKSLKMRNLIIKPKDWKNQFHIRLNNQIRFAKVPMLVINTTTLNSGHNWQFTAVDMGEHPSKIINTGQFDKNVIFQSIKYSNATAKKYQDIPLRIAVVASSAVPGIFPPLPLTELYPNATPKLVDGGLYDNQGISALLYERCTDLLVSDASGQMESELESSSGAINVLSRMNSVLMDRIRDAGFEELQERLQDKTVHNVASIHLRDEFEVDKLFPNQPMKIESQQTPLTTSYSINGNVQCHLSNIRTDLDSFTEVEAYSLMLSGYNITGKNVDHSWTRRFKSTKDFLQSCSHINSKLWQFENIIPYASGQVPNKRYLNQLEVAKERLFKLYRLESRWFLIGIIIFVLSSIIPCLLLWFLYLCAKEYPEVSYIILGLLIVLPTFFWFVKPAVGKFIWEKFILQYIFSVMVALIAWVPANLHLWIIDRMFISRGKV